MIPNEKKGYIRKPDFESDHAALRHGREVRFAEKGFECLVLPAQEQVDRSVLRLRGRTKPADSKSRKDGPSSSNIYGAIVQSLGKKSHCFECRQLNMELQVDDSQKVCLRDSSLLLGYLNRGS
jgi:hypothetical protein